MSTGTATLTLKADHENNAEAWWTAAREAARYAPSQGAEAFRRLDASTRTTEGVEVLADELAAFEAWAGVLPGYDDGPAHARLPYVVVQGDD